MKPSGRSLEIVAVGLGQAGGNIAAEFHRRGYRGLAFNTARTDLTSLSSGRLVLPESQRIYIGLEGTDGAGSDVTYGHECIAEHAAEIREAVEQHVVGADVIVVCAGLGGGTGSCLGQFKAILEDLSLPLVILTTLPHHHESGIAKVNALRGIRDLAETPSYGWVLIDNAKLASFHQDTPIDSYFETINREIVEPLDVFNRLNDRDSTRAIRTLDGEDFRSLLLSGGVLNYHTQVLPKLDASAVLDCVRNALNENPMMPAGSELANVAYLGLVIEASERALAASPFSLYEEVANHLKSETGGAAVYIGLYRQLASDTSQAMVRLIGSSRALPGSIGEMLAEAEREASTIHQKVQQNVQSLDLGGLEQLRLMRRPVPRGARALGRRTSTPAPAPEATPTDEKPSRPVIPAARAAGAGAPGPELAKRPLAQALGIRKAPPAPTPEAPPARPIQSTQVEELRSLVATGDASASATQEPETPARASSTRAKNFRARYERLSKDFRSAKKDEQRMYIARELVSAQRSNEPLERFYAVHAMTRLDPAFFRDALADAAKDVDGHVADLARQALDRLAEGKMTPRPNGP